MKKQAWVAMQDFSAQFRGRQTKRAAGRLVKKGEVIQGKLVQGGKYVQQGMWLVPLSYLRPYSQIAPKIHPNASAIAKETVRRKFSERKNNRLKYKALKEAKIKADLAAKEAMQKNLGTEATNKAAETAAKEAVVNTIAVAEKDKLETQAEIDARTDLTPVEKSTAKGLLEEIASLKDQISHLTSKEEDTKSAEGDDDDDFLSAGGDDLIAKLKGIVAGLKITLSTAKTEAGVPEEKKLLGMPKNVGIVVIAVVVVGAGVAAYLVRKKK